MNRLLIACLAALVLPSAAQAATVKVYFTRGEQLVAAKRTAAEGVEPAIRALLAGPTTAERKQGYGTAIPSTVTLLSAQVDGENVTLNFSNDFAAVDQRYLARLAQVVYTADAAGFEEIGVRGRTFTRDDFRMPEDYTAPKPPKVGISVRSPRTVQRGLVKLGYLPDDAVNGKYDYRTQQAVLAFQAWLGNPSRYHQYSLTSSPWLPSGPVSPKARSLRIGSRPFHNASARHSRCSMSLNPARPSSPHR